MVRQTATVRVVGSGPWLSRRRLLGAAAAGAAGSVLWGCAKGDEPGDEPSVARSSPVNRGRFSMPAEESPHAATWMCFPSSEEVWGSDLEGVQSTIADIALAVSDFEPVKMLVRPDARRVAAALVGADVELFDAPVDDLWARDTLPLFLRAVDPADTTPLAAGRVRFNGWGGKQVHGGDAQLAALVAEILEVPLLDQRLTGEGGGLEVDGAGTVLAARSSWVNPNRNRGMSEATIGELLVDLLGARRMLWVDGIAGEDITDGHIDTLERFADPSTIVHELPAVFEPGEVWSDVAIATERTLRTLRTAGDSPYELVALTQPRTHRGATDAFLSSYVNYYVCNGAVIGPRFGDAEADAAAAEAMSKLYPGREVVQLDIDPVAEGGGGIHCATQQQPAPTAGGR